MVKEIDNVDSISKKIKNAVDIILIILLAFLSIKKGGFYKNDNLEFNLIVTFIGTIYIIFFYIINILQKYIKKKYKVNSENVKNEKSLKIKFDIIEVLLLLLSLTYLLPIILNNYSNLADSIFEMIRYFNIYLIYVIVKKSENKKLHINALLVIIFMQCLLGIDGLANRYLLPILNKLNSGYLTSDNLTRMSGTIQYANVFSMLCILADVYVIDKLKNKSKLCLKNVVEYLGIFVFTSSIILAKSRVVLAILICYLIYIFISKKTKNKLYIFVNVLLSIIYTTIFMKLLLLNVNSAYLLTFIFYVLVIILYFFNNKIFMLLTKVKELVCKKIKNKRIIHITIIFFVCIYVVLAFCIKVPIKLDSNVNQNYVLRNIYNLDEEVLNEVSIKIKKDDADTRYKIEIFEVNDNFESNLVEKYNYYSTITDAFKFEYFPKEDIQNLMIKITCEKNSIQVLEILVNNQSNYIDYLLLPTDVVYRIEESLNGDSSLNDRLCFAKDSISLITLNIKNFFVGLGGEGFKNTYELVKSSNYHSTEVHNVYLQIFVESGVIGFCIFIALVIIALKKTKFDVIKLLLVIFCITSVFDLNFSYMLSMAIFALLLALLEEKELEKEEKSKDENKSKIKSKNKNKEKCLEIFEFFKVFGVGICGTTLVVILAKANIAYYMNVPKLDKTNTSFEQILDSVQKYEKRVTLDPYEVTYRYSLHLEYVKYLDILKSYLEEENNKINETNETSALSQSGKNIEFIVTEYKHVVQNMECNLLKMQKYDKVDVEVLTKVTDNIIEYFEIFVDEKYTFDKEAGYSYYLDIILQNIENLSNFEYDNEAKEASKSLYEYCYNKLIQLNLVNDSAVIEKYIDILNKKMVQ